MNLEKEMSEYQVFLILTALEKHGTVTAACEELGIPRMKFYRIMKRCDIDHNSPEAVINYRLSFLRKMGIRVTETSKYTEFTTEVQHVAQGMEERALQFKSFEHLKFVAAGYFIRNFIRENNRSLHHIINETPEETARILRKYRKSTDRYLKAFIE